MLIRVSNVITSLTAIYLSQLAPLLMILNQINASRHQLKEKRELDI